MSAWIFAVSAVCAHSSTYCGMMGDGSVLSAVQLSASLFLIYICFLSGAVLYCTLKCSIFVDWILPVMSLKRINSLSD